MKHASIALLVFFFAGALAGQESVTKHTFRLDAGAERPRAAVSEMRWIVGQWTGEGLGGEVDEIWTEPRDGTMVGLFRLVRDGKPVFYEILTFVEENESIVLRVKHFNRDLTGWEEKDKTVDFPWVGRDGDDYRFRGLTFRRVSSDELTIYLALRSKEGEYREEHFALRRQGGVAQAE